jgi:hypothetical protein
MNRNARIGLLGLALAAGFGGPVLASIPTGMPLSGRTTTPVVRGDATAGAALVYAAPATTGLGRVVRPDEATAREEEPPAPRKVCPKRSWPNLAPRCVADLGTEGRS